MKYRRTLQQSRARRLRPDVFVAAVLLLAPAFTVTAAPVSAPAKDAPKPAEKPPETAIAPPDPDEQVLLSLNGAKIPAVVKWLAETTRKTVIQDKEVKCELKIASPHKISRREALRQVYQALALEGIAVVEQKDFIILLPENKQMKIVPRIDDGVDPSTLAGPQLVVKVFRLKHAPASDIRTKLETVKSPKGSLQVDTRANMIIVKDSADSVRLVARLLEELDIATSTDTVVEIFSVRHAEAETLSKLVSQLYAAAGGGSPAPPRPPHPGREGPPPSQSPSAPSAGASAVRIFADKASNRLIVTAPKKDMPEIATLIERLDTERPADIAVRVVRLVHVKAEDLVTEVAPLYQKLSGESEKEIIEISANDRSNTLIVLSSEANFRDIEALVGSLDTEDAQRKAMRLFTLNNASADDVAKQLNELFTDGSDSGFRFFRYRYQSQTDNKPKFVPDLRRNAVLAVADPATLDSVRDVIATLDAPADGDSIAFDIRRLRYVSAVDVKDVLDQLFLRKVQQRRWWDDPPEEDRDVGRLFGKVRFAADLYTNSLIISAATAENLAAVEDVIRQLDTPTESGDTTLHVPLDFANAVKLANGLNILYARGGSPGPRRQERQQQQGGQRQQRENQLFDEDSSFAIEEEDSEESYFPWLDSQPDTYRRADGTLTRPVSDLVGKVRVVPYVRTNSLLITTNAHFFPQILSVVERLDVPTPQVLLEARIVEVVRDDTERFGVRWSPNGDLIFEEEDLDNSMVADVFAQYREVFSGGNLADSLRTGVFDSSINLDVLIQFLAKISDLRIKSEPRLNVADNERGKLFVGERVPFINGSINTPEGGRNDSFEYVDVGVILEVTPHINNNGEVALRVRVESSQVRDGETLLGGFILQTRNYRTDMSVKDGETLLLGGLISREEREIERKIPYLGDIPILGWLFKKRDTVERDIELMVFLRPTVTRTPEQVRRMMEEQGRRTRIISQWEDQLEMEAEEEGRNEAQAEAQLEMEAEEEGRNEAQAEAQLENSEVE